MDHDNNSHQTFGDSDFDKIVKSVIDSFEDDSCCSEEEKVARNLLRNYYYHPEIFQTDALSSNQRALLSTFLSDYLDVKLSQSENSCSNNFADKTDLLKLILAWKKQE